MDQKRQGLRSTKKSLIVDDVAWDENNNKNNEVYIALKEVSVKIDSNQTGKFPTTSNRGMKYVMIFYVYDVNYILGAPIKNRSEVEFLRVYKKVYSELQSKGFKPNFHKMDNETSTELQVLRSGWQRNDHC